MFQILPQKENSEDQEGERRTPPGRMEERKVIITGTPEAQWKVRELENLWFQIPAKEKFDCRQ